MVIWLEQTIQADNAGQYVHAQMQKTDLQRKQSIEDNVKVIFSSAVSEGKVEVLS